MNVPSILQISLHSLSVMGAVILAVQSTPAKTSDILPLRLNEIQVIGTHNSYHIEPKEAVMALIKEFSEEAAASIKYTHKPLDQQLEKLGIRQLELDLFVDPEGGLFANPAVRKILKDRGNDPGPSHDPVGVLTKPGLKIIHSPDFDYLSTSLTFVDALKSIRTWSQENPRHVPIFVLLELKESGAPNGVIPLKFDKKQLDGVDEEILSVFAPDEILTPDDIRGDSKTLRDAIITKGWPLLDEARGKVMFAMDNGGQLRDAYLAGHPSLNSRLLFASVEENHPAAAWFKINDPIGEFDRIQRLVREGYMVRTRADSNTTHARQNDTAQRESAFASGAQFISTDYREPNREFSNYSVTFDNHIVARANPVSGSASAGKGDLENLSGPWILCDGSYGGHLQGVATDGESIFWSHTVQLVKTDLHGRVMQEIDVPDHHGDLTWHDGNIYVAVELGEFNQPPGKSDPWVYVYDAKNLRLLRKHKIPELVHGSGGIAYHDGQFVVVGGLPGDHQNNYVFEYNEGFTFIGRHVLPTGQTKLGIQTAANINGHWWFGCYGTPGNPGLLKVNQNFKLIGQSENDFSYGLVQLSANTILRGECFDSNTRGKVKIVTGDLPEVEPVSSPVRMAAYNVLFGIWAEPERVGQMFKPFDLDVIGFSEVPDGDWTALVGKVLNMDHAYVGKISSANHKDKFKSILSRTPLSELHEIEINSKGWSPSSVVGAKTTVRGIPILIYSTHIPGRPNFSDTAIGSAAEFIAETVIPKAMKQAKNIVLLGDLNNWLGDAPLNRIESSGMRSMWNDLDIDTTRLSTHRHIESGTESGVIDHIYYNASSEARAIRGGVIYNAFNPHDEDLEMNRYQTEWKNYGKPLSDHRPVWAELNYTPVGKRLPFSPLSDPINDDVKLPTQKANSSKPLPGAPGEGH